MAETVKVIYDLVDEMSGDLKKINAQMDQFDKNAKANNKSTNKMGDGLAKVGAAAAGAVGGVAALTAAGAKLVAISKESIELFKEQEKAERLVGAAFGDTAKDIKVFASELQAVTVIGDEVTLTYAAFLKTMGLGEGQIRQVLTAAADLSATGLVPMESAVKNLAKTYAGLAGELGESIPALRELTQEQLKAGEGVATVARQYEGLAQAIAGTESGQIEQLNNTIGDLQEKMGGELIGVQKEFVEAQAIIQDILTDNVQVFRVVGLGAAKFAQVLTTVVAAGDLAVDTLFQIQAKAIQLASKIPVLGKSFKGFADALVEVTEEDAAESLDNVKNSIEALTGELDLSNESLTATTSAQDRYKNSLDNTKTSADQLKVTYKELFDFQRGGAGVRGQLVSSDLAVPEASVMDLKKQLREEELQEEKAFFDAKIALANDFTTASATVFDAAFQSKMNRLDAETQAEVEAVKVSTMSEKRKNEEIAKIEAKAQKESLKIRTAIWGSNLTAAGVNTSLAVTNALADPTPMPTALRVANALGVGLLGGAEVISIGANKPKFANGGVFDGTGVVSGTSYVGDSGNARINAGEGVINKEQFDNAFNNPNNTTNNNNQSTINLTVNGLDPETTAEAVVRALEHAVQNNGIDSSVLNVAAV